jgi:hypothetical protein
MTAVAALRVTDDDDVFDAASYNLPIPEVDGRKATHLRLTLSGCADLDRTSTDDLALLEAARLGSQIRLIVVGEFSGKSFKLNRKRESDELSFVCSVRVLSIEAGEAA